MSLSLNDMIKRIVDSEKDKNNSINTLKVNLQHQYEKFKKSKDEEKLLKIKEIEKECQGIVEDAHRKAKDIIDSVEARKTNIAKKYEELSQNNEELAKKIANLLFR